MTIEIRKLEDTLRLIAINVEVPLKYDAILRQGAGLVRTQHFHRTEILDRVKPLHDHLVPRHGSCTLGKVDRHNHWQHFRSEANRHSDCKQQRFKPIVLGHTVYDEDQRPHYNDEANHQPGESIDVLVERCRDVSARDFISELAKKRLGAGADNQASAVPAYDIGSHEADIWQIERIDDVPRRVLRRSSRW